MIYLGNSPVGVAVGAGGITAYQKATVSASHGEISSSGNRLTFSHNLGKIPKFVVVKEAEGETATAGNLNYYSCNNIIGGDSIISASTGSISRYVVSSIDSSEPLNGKYYFSENVVKLQQSANTTHWDTGINYTIELWG